MAKVLHSHCLGRPNGHRATFLLYGEARRPQIVTLKLRAENFDLQKHNLVPKLFLTRLLTEQRFHCLGRPDGHRGTLPLLGEARRPQSYVFTAWGGPTATAPQSHCLGRPDGHRATLLLPGEARRPQSYTLTVLGGPTATELRSHCLKRPDGQSATLSLPGEAQRPQSYVFTVWGGPTATNCYP